MKRIRCPFVLILLLFAHALTVAQSVPAGANNQDILSKIPEWGTSLTRRQWPEWSRS